MNEVFIDLTDDNEVSANKWMRIEHRFKTLIFACVHAVEFRIALKSSEQTNSIYKAIPTGAIQEFKEKKSKDKVNSPRTEMMKF